MNADWTTNTGWTPKPLVGLGSGPPVMPTIGGMFYPGMRHLLSGESEAGKSWLAYGMLADQVRRPKGVMLVDLEMGPVLSLERFRQLGLTDDEIDQWVCYLEPSKALAGQELDELDNALHLYEPGLVVVDSLDKLIGLHGLDPLSNKDVDVIFEHVVERFRAYNAAVLLLDGVTKSRDRGRYSMGAGRKLYDTDVHFGIEAVKPFGRGQTGISKIHLHKDRGGRHRRGGVFGMLHLESDPNTEAVTWRTDQVSTTPGKPFRPTVLMERISRYLEAVHEPQSRNAIERDVAGNREAKRTAMDVLLADGYINETNTGNARLMSLSKPFREATDTPDTTTSPIRPNLAQTSPMGERQSPRPFAPFPIGGDVGEPDSDDEVLS